MAGVRRRERPGWRGGAVRIRDGGFLWPQPDVRDRGADPRTCQLAHAEVNALVRLDPRRRYEHHTLVTTLEPCPLCVGALAMSTIGRLTYLGADPYGGAVGRLANTAHTARVPVQVSGPRRDDVGTLASALHVAYYLQRNPSGAVVRFHEEHRPELLKAGSALLEQGAWHQARDEVLRTDVLDSLLTAVSPWST